MCLTRFPMKISRLKFEIFLFTINVDLEHLIKFYNQLPIQYTHDFTISFLNDQEDDNNTFDENYEELKYYIQ